jgi:DNA recombination protein RmuC
MDIIETIVGLVIGVILTIVLLKLFRPKNDITKLNKSNTEKDSNIRALEIENAKLESELSGLKSIKKKSETEFIEVKKNHDLISIQHAEINTKLKNALLINSDLVKSTNNLTQQKERLQNEKSELSSKVSALDTINNNLQTQQKEIADVEKRFNTEFENIAGRLIKQNSESLTQNSSNSLNNILNPLKEDLERFKKNIDDKYIKEAESKASLKTEIESLVKLNEQLSDDAHNLTRALTGNNKHQGNWGEIVLERVLERSGLNKGSEYKLQEHITTEDGTRRIPDAVVFLPDDKHIIIDSKVSLTAYQRMVNARNSEVEKTELKLHVSSLKSHIKELGDKSYYDTKQYNSPDFTLMFLPIEASFSVALREDTELFNYAWERNIVIVSPTTLLATLRTIESTWKHERQTRNVLEIARVGGTLFDKFAGFVEDLKKIEKGIKQSQTAYDSAFNKLQSGKGNIISQTERLKSLGAKAKKSLPSDVLDEKFENAIEKNTYEAI